MICTSAMGYVAGATEIAYRHLKRAGPLSILHGRHFAKFLSTRVFSAFATR